jgi:RNA polymerase sigma-70 factor (sigma-E family)
LSDGEDEFTGFFGAHAGALGRLAYLLVGDRHAAEDLTADVFLDVWRSWDRVSSADHPLAYVRKVMINKASAGVRRTVRERLGLERLRGLTQEISLDPDSAAVLDVQALLMELPAGQRACLVLRYAFDLSESEVADALGVSVGTVKSQSSKAVRRFRRRMDEAGPGAAESARGSRDEVVVRAAGGYSARNGMRNGGSDVD